MQKEWRNTKTDNLFKAILSLKNILECEKFFRDLLTVQEIEEFSNRWEVVRLLEQKVPYRKIAEKTGVSTATITRINFWLNQGQGGYQLALTRTKSANQNGSKSISEMRAVSEPSSVPSILAKKNDHHRPTNVGH